MGLKFFFCFQTVFVVFEVHIVPKSQNSHERKNLQGKDYHCQRIITIVMLIMTTIWLCPLYALWAQPEHSCSQSVPISLFSVMAEKKLFSEKHPLLFNKENQILEFHYFLNTQVTIFFLFLIFLLRNKYFSTVLNILEE